MQDQIAKSVRLAVDEAEFTLRGKPQRLPCTITLEANPRLRLLLRLTGVDPLLIFGSEQRFSVRLIAADIEVEAFLSSVEGDVVAFSPERTPIVVGRSDDLKELHFDLINFPIFWALASPSSRLLSDHLDIAASGWHIEIRPPRKSPDLDSFQSTLHCVTHSCAVRRGDGSTFSSSEAQNLLNALHDAMSFAAGRWVAPVFVRAFGRDQRVAWKEWGTRPIHPNIENVDTWFDQHHGNTLAEILPGILELQKDAGRYKTFHSALYWYLRSTGLGAGIDGGIILLQAALELLSWQVFVADHKAAISGGGIGRRVAGEVGRRRRRGGTGHQVRLLIERFGIPVAIPAGLGDLGLKAKEFNWMDGPKALAAVRNLLVHPDPAQRDAFPYYEAFRLAKWYVELALLRMLGFAGEYSNRTKAERWVGSVDPVPWATLTQTI